MKSYKLSYTKVATRPMECAVMPAHSRTVRIAGVTRYLPFPDMLFINSTRLQAFYLDSAEISLDSKLYQVWLSNVNSRGLVCGVNGTENGSPLKPKIARFWQKGFRGFNYWVNNYFTFNDCIILAKRKGLVDPKLEDYKAWEALTPKNIKETFFRPIKVLGELDNWFSLKLEQIDD